MAQFLPTHFFSWISSIFVGFFKSSRFFVSFCTISSFLYGVGLESKSKVFRANMKVNGGLDLQLHAL